MLIAKYKFDSSLYDLIPEFNSGYTGYTYTDEVDGNIVTRTIECDTLPTMMRFGCITAEVPGHVYSLLEILDMNTSGLTTMYAMFRWCNNLTSISCNWDTSKVTNMGYAFCLCQKLSNLDVSNFNTSNVAHMFYMFYDCNNLNTIDISKWDTKQVTEMQHMFYNCTRLTSLDVSNWNTSQVTTMQEMFRGCKNLTTLDVSKWDTSQVTSMATMFYGCSNIMELDVSNWVTSRVNTTNAMFYNCYNLTSLNVADWDMHSNIMPRDMFGNCNNLSTLDLSKWNTSNFTSIYGTFTGCNSLIELDVGNWDVSKVSNMQYTFFGCGQLTSLDLSKWDVSKVSSMAQTFYNCRSLISLNISTWKTDSLTSLSGTFENCMALTSLDLSKWNVSKVTSMYCMFRGCSSLTELNVTGWNTSSVTTIESMFYNCRLLKSIDVRGWNTSKLTSSLYRTFGECKALTRLDLSSWNIGAFSIYCLLEGCTSLVTLDLGNWDISQSISTNILLGNCTVLKYIKCNNIQTINTLSKYLRTTQGTIVCKQRDLSDLDMATLNSKNWTVTNEPILVAKYVFDKSIYNNTIPTFNGSFEGYFIEDVEIEGNEVTRVIESCGMLPASMQFGQNWTQNIVVSNKSKSLLEVNYVNTDNINKVSNMFRYNTKLRKINCEDWNLGEATSLSAMFGNCESLRSVDLSKWDTSKITHTDSMFCNCAKLQSANLSNWNVENVTVMGDMFIACDNLVDLNISNWKISSLSSCNRMFQSCRNLPSLDLSNWDMSNVTNGENIFSNTLLLTDIGMLNCNKSTIQKIVDSLPNVTNRTIWYKETNVEGITVPSHVKLRKYKEESVEIVLNSPLLEGDSIEVVNGKLCHVHRYEKVVLDGSENWGSPHNFFWIQKKYLPSPLKEREAKKDSVVFVDTLEHGYIDNSTANNFSINRLRLAIQDSGNGGTNIRIILKDIKDNDIDGLKQWLSENPTTIIYKLETPYYEDITPLQSSLTLRTFEECSMEIITNLPIKTNITYRTNITSAYELERQVNSVDTSGVSLANLIEEEVDE